MVSSTGSTPAKKAVPSLADLTKKNDNKDDKKVPETTPETETNSAPTPPTPEEVRKEQENNTVVGLTTEDSNKKDDVDTNETSGLSNSVVHETSTNKTPAEMSSMTPDESAKHFNVVNKITDEDIKNPRVQVYSDTVVKQVPSGTHLHPDVAKDLHNYGIADRTTDSAQVKRTITETYDFAESAETNDKF